MPDLHTHSTASDGTLSPTGLVERAAAAGLRTMALTDHDTTEGVEEALTAGDRLGVRVVPGVEISVTWNGRTVHVVGLGVDPDNAVLQAGLAGLRRFRDWRAEEMGRRLEKKGIAGAFDGAKALSGGTLIGRTHFARFLVERHIAASEREVFQRFLTRGKPGHVAGDWASLAAATSWIRAAGGQTVLAHPARYSLTRTRLLHLIGEFKEHGGVGIEVVSGSHSRNDALNFAQLARAQRLLASAGSDFHGPQLALAPHPWIDLGRLPPLPDGCLSIWHDWSSDEAPVPRGALSIDGDNGRAVA